MLATHPTHNDYRAERERLKAIEFGTAAEEDFKTKAYTKSELAEMYGVHVNTLSKWIDRHLEKFEAIGYKKAQDDGSLYGEAFCGDFFCALVSIE